MRMLDRDLTLRLFGSMSAPSEPRHRGEHPDVCEASCVARPLRHEQPVDRISVAWVDRREYQYLHDDGNPSGIRASAPAAFC